jgi:hypothetical protein
MEGFSIEKRALTLRILRRTKKTLALLLPDESTSRLDELCENVDGAASIEDVEQLLGGGNSKVAQAFLSVMDDAERTALESDESPDQIEGFVSHLKAFVLPNVEIDHLRQQVVQFVQELPRSASLALPQKRRPARPKRDAPPAPKESAPDEKNKTKKKKQVVRKQERRPAEGPETLAVEATTTTKRAKPDAGLAPAAVAPSPEPELAHILRSAEEEFEDIRALMTQDKPVAEASATIPLFVNFREVAEHAEHDLLEEVIEECLVDAAVPIGSVETLGTLQSWRRIAIRCCQIAGLFARLRPKTRTVGVRMEDRYAELVRSHVDHGVLSFTQAARYDRVGQFLIMGKRLQTFLNVLDRTFGKQKIPKIIKLQPLNQAEEAEI